MVFIDGLHLYDQVRRDLDGALRVLKPGGWIAFHDMLPRDWFEEHVPQIRTRGWTGDGWKVAFELLASADVEFRLLAIDHGVVVVKPLTRAPRIPDLSATLGAARFAYLYENSATLAHRWLPRRLGLDRFATDTTSRRLSRAPAFRVGPVLVKAPLSPE